VTYFFAGIKHSGKSTHAKLFAKYKHLPFYDLDRYIEDNIKYKSVRELYKTEGQEAFQRAEYNSLIKLLLEQKEDKVIALGGGICDNDKAFLLCNNLIFIDINEKTLFDRINFLGLPPFLQDDPKNQFHSLYIHRRPLYLNRAKLVIELEDLSIEDAFNIIKNKINKWER